MTTAVEYKKYKDLLDALAEFLRANGGNPDGLDSFLKGYAGQDWQAAKGRALVGPGGRRYGPGR